MEVIWETIKPSIEILKLVKQLSQNAYHMGERGIIIMGLRVLGGKYSYHSNNLSDMYVMRNFLEYIE